MHVLKYLNKVFAWYRTPRFPHFSKRWKNQGLQVENALIKCHLDGRASLPPHISGLKCKDTINFLVTSSFQNVDLCNNAIYETSVVVRVLETNEPNSQIRLTGFIPLKVVPLYRFYLKSNYSCKTVLHSSLFAGWNCVVYNITNSKGVLPKSKGSSNDWVLHKQEHKKGFRVETVFLS